MKLWTRVVVVSLLIGVFGGFARADQAKSKSDIPQKGTDVDRVAAELVREIIEDESQIEKVRALYLRFKGKWTHTPEAIAKSRAELEKQHPNTKILPERYPNLRPEMTEDLVLAWDDRRLLKFADWHNAQLDVRMWDGKRGISHLKYFTHEQEQYGLFSRPEELLDSFFIDLSWLRVAAHHFWWSGPELTQEERTRSFGVPEDFVVVKERDYRGRRCVELKSKVTVQRRLYVGKDDRRLHALVHLGMKDAAHVLAALGKIAGREFKSTEEYEAWDKERSPEEKANTFERMIDEYGVPGSEFYLDDYREVGDGLWIPAKQGYVFGAGKSHRDLELVEGRINEPLDDKLFEMELRDGVDVYDRTHDPPLSYKQKSDRTPEEWQEIIDTHRRQNEEWKKAEAAREALVGRVAPEFPQSKWLNSEPLSWKALRGKVVLLHFWSHWCGPCHNDLPDLARRYKDAGRQNVVIIGVHTPGSDSADIEKDVKQYDLGYPILIDVRRASDQAATLGLLSHQLGINGIPHTVVVDAEGKIAAQGHLQKTLGKAFELAQGKR